jgi:hypothetical protein
MDLIEGVHYKIIDNFLPEEDFKLLQSTMLSTIFPWYYTNTINGSLYANEVTYEPYDFMLCHVFYSNSLVTSPHMPLLGSLLTKINAFGLLRIKANMYARTEKIIRHGWHVDFTDVKFKTAIFYLNSNNGKTIFKDGLTVDSVENRLVEFDTNLLHCSTTCTDQNIRCNINLNYVPKPIINDTN